MEFPLTVVKGKDKEKVHHAPDLKGWLDAGWKLEASEEKEPSKKEAKEPAKGLDI